MANRFHFLLTKSTLEKMLFQLQQKEIDLPGKEVAMQVSIDLVFDGVGYVTFNLKTEVIDQNAPTLIQYDTTATTEVIGDDCGA